MTLSNDEVVARQQQQQPSPRQRRDEATKRGAKRGSDEERQRTLSGAVSRSLLVAGSGSGGRTMTRAVSHSLSPSKVLLGAVLCLGWALVVLGAPAPSTSTNTKASSPARASNTLEVVPELMPMTDNEINAHRMLEDMKIIMAPFGVEEEPARGANRVKRSGISDQRLAEIQMIRALKKQLERASKLAAASQLMQDAPEATNSNTS